MDIFVCLKQVPDTNRVQVDETTGVLKRDGVSSKLNPYDLFALETALRLRERHGGTVAVGTMGPKQAEAVIREAYWMGADEGYVFSDRRLGGADVLATSYALSQAIRRAGDFDLILCGKQTTDGDTAQVGPALAEHLDIPHAAWVSHIEVDGDGVAVEQQLQSEVLTAWMPFPCLVTVEQDIHMPRLPSLKAAREVRDRPVKVLTLDAFWDTDPAHYGLSGSATQVERIFPPENDVKRETWAEGEAADRLRAMLEKIGLLKKGGGACGADRDHRAEM
ncbi:MAG: electron transfer flavoprotein subunit beta/FixA family protein [Clostridiales bacterium]|jgi:electron transfer flavoprotein beta subunit|nr:electron transfer flavoprotein subunit beta/FixA family protein [Clostridiales bacterium]OPZ68721.1 MAG: Acryloyl-CoA reductase electron transfer subunit gamma [Firmicutes bacterium ADurb.Bin467]